MKKFLALIMLAGMILALGQGAVSAQGKILVAYFSRVGEESGGVGVITKGNTEIVAELIAQKTGADLFEIKTVTPYPSSYRECTDIARREKSAKARPELSAAVENFAQYDTIFLGMPVWYGDAPMAVYTFLESYDFSGKTIVPFVTHAGSGLSGIDRKIGAVCKNSKILAGFALRGATAQNDSAQTNSKVSDWLKQIGMN